MSTIVVNDVQVDANTSALDLLRLRHSAAKTAAGNLRDALRADGSAKVWTARAALLAKDETGLSNAALSRESGIPRATLIGYLQDGEALVKAGHEIAVEHEPTTAEIDVVAKVRERRARADKAAKAKRKKEAEAGRKAAEGEVSGEAGTAVERSTPKGEDEDALTYGGAEALMTRLIAQLAILEKTGPQTEADEIARGNVLQMLQTAVNGMGA